MSDETPKEHQVALTFFVPTVNCDEAHYIADFIAGFVKGFIGTRLNVDQAVVNPQVGVMHVDSVVEAPDTIPKWMADS